MLDTHRLLAETNDRITRCLADTLSESQALGPDAVDVVGLLGTFLTGGKRFRAMCTLLGYATEGLEPSSAAIDVAAGLEVFHAAALVHDDIMDRSDTRRGRESAHRMFEGRHRAENFDGDPEHFGASAALLYGDLLLALSDELICAGLEALPSSARSARAEFNAMRREVTLGQYLDVLAEVSESQRPAEERLAQAIHVVTYKSAKYSIEAPLRIGAALAGASPEHLDRLSDFGVPLGIAFQLRDDMLGVFGAAEETGKPVGDDLREGKRTALMALASEHGCDVNDLGNPAMTAERVAEIQSSLRSSGAEAALEALIDSYTRSACAALDALDVTPEVRDHLADLVDRVTQRTS